MKLLAFISTQSQKFSIRATKRANIDFSIRLFQKVINKRF